MASFPEKGLSGNGMIHLDSRYSVEETIARVEAAVLSHGLAVFCRIDHSGEAAKAGLTMRPTLLLIFGSPKQGTPVMVASPTLAIDLPLKALAWEDETGKVRLSYNAPEYLKGRHNIPDELLKNLSGAGTLLQKAIE